MRVKIIALSSLALASAIGYACCGVSGGQPVHFKGQTNIIIWDPNTGTEHFIRSAAFDTKAKDFGFIAPTPTIPEIVEVSKGAFTLLDSLRPVTKNSRTGGLGAGGFGGGGQTTVAPVVIQIKEVGGYIATTLKATDARGLTKWLKDNEYETSPSIERWTKFYIRKEWYLTAFKVINKDGDPQTGVIRMTFKTNRAFNPYLVPSENSPEKGRGRGLKLHFISRDPHIPANPPNGTRIFNDFSTRIKDETAQTLMRQLKLEEFPSDASYQHFLDPSFPNVNAIDDLYFALAPRRISGLGSGVFASFEFSIRSYLAQFA